MANPIPDQPRTIDIRPELPEGVQTWTLADFRDYYRTINHRLGMVWLLVSARGLEDPTTQAAWSALAVAVRGGELGD